MARDGARQHRLQLLDNIDPLEAKRAARDEARRQSTERLTFKQAALEYHQIHADGWKNRKHGQQFASTLAAYAFPSLGDRTLTEIDAAAINAALAPIWTRIPTTAARTKNRIERVIDWVKSGRPLPRKRSENGKEHHPALPYQQIGEFLAELRGKHGVAARALELLILTATRTSEVTGAQWSEIDLDAKIWTIPAQRMKAARSHRVPLSNEATCWRSDDG